MRERDQDDLADDDAEVVDALPVITGEGPRAAAPPPQVTGVPAAAPARTVPVAQAAAVAATGFAAGAVTAALVRGATKRRAAKSVTKRQGKGKQLPVLGTRSFLVDVHLLGPRD